MADTTPLSYLTDSTVNVERIKMWTDALRSGEYTQTIKQLRRDNNEGSKSYCCLGVACEIYHRETGLGTWSEYESFKVDDFSSSTVLPLKVAQWFGFNSAGGMHLTPANLKDEAQEVGLGGPHIALFDLNDHLRWDFVKIADYIDAHIEDFNNYNRVDIGLEDK